MNLRRRVLTVAAVVLAGIGTAAQQPAPDSYRQLKWRYIGPSGNRAIAVAGLPGDPLVYYVGAASGGIFKTTDAGAHWVPIFDDQPVSSVGSLAVAPSDPNIVWAGTGETCIRSNISIGNGIYKSTDAGKTWTRMGLDNTGRIGRIVIHPDNPDVVFAAAMGHSYGPQPERGLFRTTDGGQTWDKVLFVDEHTGASDVAMDPSNPRILFAGMWQLEIHTWGRSSGGAGGGLFTSRDGGTTWRRLTGHGLPEKPMGKVAVDIARSNPRRIYALIETGDGVPWNDRPTDTGQLWRSDDGGDTWKVVSHDRQLRGRSHYYTHQAVAPDNHNEVYFLTAAWAKTLDGGQTIIDPPVKSTPAGDHHDMWIDPSNGNRMIVAHDDGIAISVNRGETWQRLQLPIAQMYHVAVDNQIPYNVFGNRQDGPSTRGPSHSRLPPGFGQEAGATGPIPRGMWHSVAGSESGWAIPDPVDNNIIWATGTGYGSLGGVVERFDERTRQARRVEVWPDFTMGWPAADLKYRFNWTFPITISPHDHNTVYAGSQHVHRTTNGGQSWDVISPDLTLNDTSRQRMSGGLTPDNIGVEYAGVVFAIAESPLEKGLIWAGTNDGQVQVTRDAGATWTNVTKNIPGLPAWGTVSNVEPSRYDRGGAYITVDLHQVNNRDPFVYKTTDYGRSWRSISGDIPKTVFSYTHCVREDPVRQGLLYLGTENTVYVSFNDGQNWLPLQSGLPHAPMHWLVVQEHFSDLVLATYGRGFYILDDVTPLRQMTPEILASAAHVFEPRAAYRFRPITEPMMTNDDPVEARNPPDGASITYYLKAAPEGDVKVAILDGAGKTIRTLTGTKEPGVNRIWWDLKHEMTTEIKLRTSPTYAPEVKPGPEGWRPFPTGGRFAPLVVPGVYTVKLLAGGQESTQKLTVRKDPNTTGTEADIQAQALAIAELRDSLNAVANAVNQIELVRSQISSLTRLLGDGDTSEAVKSAADDLDKKLIGVEEQLFNMRATGRGQDMLRWPAGLVEKMVYLADGLGLADFAPANEQLAVLDEFKRRADAARSRVNDLMTKDLATFNTLVRDKGIGSIVGTVP